MKVLKYECKKVFYEAITYYPDFIVSTISNIILFIVLFQSINSEKITTEVYGYVLWLLTSNVLSEISLAISTEKQLGTLQNLMVKPNSIMKILLCKTIGWFLVNFIKIFLVLIILSFFVPFPAIYDINFLYICIMTCVGILGLSFLLGAFTLIYTKMASFEMILNYILLFLSGTFTKLPDFVYYTNPLSFGTKMIENLYLQQITLQDNLLLFIISIMWFLTGYMIFRKISQHSKSFRWTY